MAHVNCPKCGMRLKLPQIQKTQGVRCGVVSELMNRKGGMSEKEYLNTPNPEIPDNKVW